MKYLPVLLAIALLGACSNESAPGGGSAITDEMRIAYPEFATDFAKALTSGDYDAAYDMLSPEMKRKNSADSLGYEFEEMVKYGGSPARVDGFIETLDDWPDKATDEVGWVYVSVGGDDYAEAVIVVVSVHGDGLAINSVEWGRP